MPPRANQTAIHWFRKGLRLHDNPALLAACHQATAVYPIFIIDPHFAKPEYVGVLRYNFLLQCLADLDSSLRKNNSRLYVVRGKPHEVLPQLFDRWNVGHLTFESDTEPYAKRRDEQVKELADKHGVKITTCASHTLHDPDSYLSKCGGADKIPLSYGAFQKIFGKLGQVAQPVDRVGSDKLPPRENLKDFDSDEYSVPTLQEMGYPPIQEPQRVLYPGGETEALDRLDRHLKREKWIAEFEKPKTPPNSLDPSTTVLSPYLKFGCLSPRYFWHALDAVYRKFPKHAQPPVSLHGQLLWREFFYMCGYATPNYDKMEGNRICRQIPWDWNEEYAQAWENARTGYPFIDACMTQLHNEGWIHHLARHAVACFLTRGDLFQSWTVGARVFDRLLLDADWSINNANWMWLSCSCFFYQYFRVYSPIAFGKKTDPSGHYIRKHLPILSKFPDKYIYEPWKAPLAVQKKAGCIIGQDYPEPIVEHSDVSKANMSRIKEAYDRLKGSSSAGGEAAGKRKAADADAGAKKKRSKKASSSRDGKVQSKLNFESAK